MKIKSQKAFWSGLMFIGSGLLFAFWAMAFYQMGTAVRMGPAYFPTVLGFLLAVLGGIVLLQSVTAEPEGDQVVHAPFNFIDFVIAIAIYAVLIFLSQKLGFARQEKWPEAETAFLQDFLSDYGIGGEASDE